jgi:hypothetical protein
MEKEKNAPAEEETAEKKGKIQVSLMSDDSSSIFFSKFHFS